SQGVVSECRYHGAFVLLHDEVFYRVGLQCVRQFLHGVAVFVVRAGNQDVYVGRLRAFDDQSVFRRVQTGFQRVVGVDQSNVYLVQDAGQGCGFEFFEVQVFGVVGDVTRSGGDLAFVFQSNQASLLQQQERTAAIGGVVGDGDNGPVFQLVEGFDFGGVGAEGLNVDAGYGDQAGATAVVEFIQVRLVLEEVSVHPLLVDLDVRLYVVGEDFHIQLHALLGQGRFYEFQQFRVRYGSSGHRQFFCDSGCGESCYGSDGYQGFLEVHFCVLLWIINFATSSCSGVRLPNGSGLPKNARKYIPVGLRRAIPGAPDFREAAATRAPMPDWFLSSGLYVRLFTAEIQHQAVTRHLQQLYEDHQQSDGYHHHIGLKTLVTKTNGQITQATATDNTRHRRVGHQRDGCHSYACDDARKCFRQQGTEDDLAD